MNYKNMAKASGLGRGLGSLIPIKTQKKISEVNFFDEAAVNNTSSFQDVSPEQIMVNPLQPRQEFNHADLEELIESIKEHGIIQPLTVTRLLAGGYQLIAGERRLRAAKILELPTVPVIIRDVKDQEKLEIALIENIQRKNLNPMEMAIAYQKLVDEFGLTQEEVAQRIGKSRSKVANSLRLLYLPAEIQEAISEEKISEGHAKIIAGLETPEEQNDFFRKILRHNLSVHETETMAKGLNSHRSRKSAVVAKDYEIQAKEELLRDGLGTKVSINKKANGRGQINIEFYSSEELDRLIDKIVG